MTRLLVSVRSRDEAECALLGGADIIDVKEPDRGSLGAPSRSSLRDIIHWMRERAPQIPLSVACGELEYHPDPDFLHEFAADLSWAKIGLCGVQHEGLRDRWQELLQQFWRAYPEPVRPVAVLYADFEHCAAPSLHQVLNAARSGYARYVLIDTWNKDRGSLFQVVSPDVVSLWCSQIRNQGCIPVLAGSLRIESLSALGDIRPDVLAIRGAACIGSRKGKVCADRVRQFRAAMDQHGLFSQGSDLLAPAQHPPRSGFR